LIIFIERDIIEVSIFGSTLRKYARWHNARR